MSGRVPGHEDPLLQLAISGDYLVFSVTEPATGEITEAVVEVSRGVEIIDWWMLRQDRLTHSDDATGSHLVFTRQGEALGVQVLYGLDHSSSETATATPGQVPVIMWGLHAGEVLDQAGAEIRWAWFMHDYPNS